MSAAPLEPELESAYPEHIDIDISFEDLSKSLKCMGAVIGNVFGDSDFKPLYDEYKQKAEAVVRNDLMKCRDMGNPQSQLV